MSKFCVKILTTNQQFEKYSFFFFFNGIQWNIAFKKKKKDGILISTTSCNPPPPKKNPAAMKSLTQDWTDWWETKMWAASASSPCLRSDLGSSLSSAQQLRGPQSPSDQWPDCPDRVCGREANRQTSQAAEVTSVKCHNEIFQGASGVPEKRRVVPTAGHYLLHSLQNHKRLSKRRNRVVLCRELMELPFVYS